MLLGLSQRMTPSNFWNHRLYKRPAVLVSPFLNIRAPEGQARSVCLVLTVYADCPSEPLFGSVSQGSGDGTDPTPQPWLRPPLMNCSEITGRELNHPLFQFRSAVKKSVQTVLGSDTPGGIRGKHTGWHHTPLGILTNASVCLFLNRRGFGCTSLAKTHWTVS